MGVRRVVAALSAAAWVASVAGAAPLAPPRFDAPRGVGGRVAWPALAPPQTTRDTAALIVSLADRPMLAPYALRLAGALRIARKDSAGADSCWASLASLDSPWTWEALRQRADLASARGATAHAESLLAGARPAQWAALDRAAWRARRARLALALGDSASALRFALELVRSDPGLPPAAAAVELADTLAQAGVGVLSALDQIASAETEARQDKPHAATTRIERMVARDPTQSVPLHLRLARWHREARHWNEAVHALETALRGAHSDSTRAVVLLARARLEADRWQAGAALAAAEACIRADPTGASALMAHLEAANARERLGDLAGARAAYAAAASGDTPAAQQAALRAALLWIADSRPDSALRWLQGNGEAASFWRAVVLRRNDRATADSLLRDLARRPGYGFYRVAARESLGVTGWTGKVSSPRCDGDGCAPLRLAAALVAVGADAEAMVTLYRWVTGSGRGSLPALLLEASRIAYTAGRLPPAIQYARLAAETRGLPDSVSWGVAPWIHPPAYDSLYGGLPAAPGTAGSVDRDLARGLTWQESKFDSSARSRSNAVGLMQLVRPTAAEVARSLGLARPSLESLENPALNVRLGTAYLSQLLARFEGNVVASLGAYNIGATRVPANWRSMVGVGGDALLAELLPEPARDYAKRVLAARAGYRELSPSVAGRP